MEDLDVLDGSGVRSAGVTSPSDESLQPSISLNEGENRVSDMLDDLDVYLEDISDRLTISRMVNDSVIKGMVNAVTEESAEKIALKELEVQRLKERLIFYEADADKVRELRYASVGSDIDTSQLKVQSSFPGTCAQRGRVEVSFVDLQRDAEKHFQRLQKDINELKDCKMDGKMTYGVSTQRLGGQIRGKVDDKWEEVNKTLNMLRSVVDTVFHQVDHINDLSKKSLSKSQQERRFQEEIEAMVIQNSIRSLQEELKIEVCSGDNINQLASEISNLRQELDFISKSLSSSEPGYLPCHGSHESGEEWNASSKDNINQKACNHIIPPSPFQKENGNHEPKSSPLDRMDSADLKHKSIDELINFFKSEIANMNRYHESMLQERTEAYFSLRREFLKERGPLSLRRDKEFDALKKKIPEVISKLDGILKEKKELPVSYEDSMCIRISRDRLDALYSENRLLKDRLANKNEEVKFLSSQVSDVTDKMSHHSLTEIDMLEETRKLNDVMEDLKMDIAVREDINLCILKDVVRNFRCDVEDSDTKFRVMQDICRIIFSESVKDAEAMMEWGLTDLDMEYIIMQEVCGTVYREAVKDAQAAINLVNAEYKKENGNRVCLEATLLETKKALRSETQENEKLKQEKLLLLKSVVEKEKLALEIESTMIKDKKCYELVCQELNQLKDHVKQQQKLISESNKKSDSTRSKFEEALKCMDQYEGEIGKLNQNLKLAMEKLSVVDGEKRALHASIHEKQATISLLKSKERKQRKEMECIIVSIGGLSKAVADFECRLTENVEHNSLRLEKLTSQCHPLAEKAKVLKRMGLIYKQRLERRYSDLQKAESEVDLLGDEVDALLNLLEKIYIALDHYSPILQHYPGIMEILKLIRRELSGDTVKPS